MPLEIRELVIKVTIEEHSPQAAAQTGLKDIQALKDKIVRECMDKLMTTIENLPTR
ncbi:hypothetical protein FHW36_11736 [Chitinophaga polysaccharea]|uniref:Uncharacterized protein n=1 Tax=Chitinophaga polysaccharea TaxID=1293035 RepID=A0A561P150_9BACT|nr:DUF5908 family protein [Chitinophaga polysaccharea]TWF31847.1 hypothetical protein FHW36_11736 [Chitinophaga polysaccharea]